MRIYLVLFYVVNLLGFIPLLLILKNKSVVSNFKRIFPYTILVGFAAFYELLFSHILKVNVEIWFKIYSFSEFFFILYIFKGQENKPGKYFFWVFTFIYLSVFIFLTFFSSEIHFLKQDSFFNLITIFFIVSFYVVWIYKNFKLLEVNSLLELPFFYFISGLILYYAGIIVLSLLSEVIINSELSINEYWLVNISLLILFRILLIVSIWKARAT